MTTKSGGCMCGLVRFEANNVPEKFGVCHCEMCRRWTGSALLGVTVERKDLQWEDETEISTCQSSAWAERGWCRKCGTSLYFRVTAVSPYTSEIEIPLGLFDDPNGFEMASEIYIDHKPDSFAFAGAGRTLMTRQDCVAKFSILDSE